MKYLIFDLEFASSKNGIKICEFGYVVTNEKFEVLEKDNLIINPNLDRADWDYHVVNKILTRKIYEYERCTDFADHYEKITWLIKQADYIFGHTMDSDAKALNDDCKRYYLPSINFIFYDIRDIYKAFSNAKKSVGVEEMLNRLNIEGDKKTHDAEADAYNTMLELKAMLDALEMSVNDLISLCPEAQNSNSDYEVASNVLNKLLRAEREEREEKEGKEGKKTSSRGPNEFSKYSKKGRIFLQFLDNVKPTEDCTQNLKDKRLSISINYEEKHFIQIVALNRQVQEGIFVVEIHHSLMDFH